MPHPRVSQESAASRLQSAGYEPLEPYRGSRARWRIRCLTCGNESRKTLYEAEHHGCKWCVHGLISERDANALAALNRLTPLEPFQNVSTPWRMLCQDCGRESRTRLDRLRAHRGCIYCKAKRKLDADEAAQMARSLNLEPLEPFPGSRQPWKVQCLTCGSEWVKRWDAIRDGHGCAQCSQVFVSPEQADADFRAAGFTPQGAYENTRAYRTCTCNTCGHDVTITREQILNQRPCPYCSGAAVHPTDALAVMQTAGFEPLEPYRSVDTPWLSQCRTCGKTVAPHYRTVQHGSTCVYCARRKVDDSDAQKVMTDAGLMPLEPYPGGKRPWKCRCMTCHRVVSPTMTRVKGGGSKGCAYCSGVRVDAEDAVAIMKAAGFTPLEPYRGGKRGWRSRCDKCGQESSPHFSSVQNGSSCRWCRPYGIDLTRPAVLYIVTHSEFGAHKIGISQDTSPRIAVHQRYEWQVSARFPFDSGLNARRVEQAVLDWLRNVLDLPPHLSAEFMPQGGWTETVSSDSVSVPVLKKAVQRFSTTLLERRTPR